MGKFKSRYSRVLRPEDTKAPKCSPRRTTVALGCHSQAPKFYNYNATVKSYSDVPKHSCAWLAPLFNLLSCSSKINFCFYPSLPLGVLTLISHRFWGRAYNRHLDVNINTTGMERQPVSLELSQLL